MKLYKYRTINKNTLTNLFLGLSYFPSARELNDPCDAQMQIVKPTDKKAINTLALQIFSECLPPNASVSMDNSKGNFELLFHRFADQKIEEFSSKGIYSLSESPDNHLMWSHYGDSHKGLCIEYEADPTDFKFFDAVEYTDTHDAITLERMISDPDSTSQDYYFIKTSAWKYEREWRLLTIKGGSLGADELKITGLILGARASDIDSLSIAGHATNQNIGLYKAEIREGDKKVLHSSVDSKQFAGECAKRLGIIE